MAATRTMCLAGLVAALLVLVPNGVGHGGRVNGAGDPPATDILAWLPAVLDGAEAQIGLFDGLTWIDRFDPTVPAEADSIASAAAAVGSLGATLDELEIVAARYDHSPGNVVAVTAWRLQDTPAAELAMPALRAMYEPEAELVLRVDTVAGSEVIKVRDLTLPGVYRRVLHAVDDVVWIIDADEEALASVLAALPASADGSAPSTLLEPAGDSVWRVTEPGRGCRMSIGREAFGTPDGSLWMVGPAGVRELGGCEMLGIGGPSRFTARDAAMAPDGTLWVLDDTRLMTWSDNGWVVHRDDLNTADGDCAVQDCYLQVEVAPDGVVWLGGGTVSSFDGTEWRHFFRGVGGYVASFGLDGSIWVVADDLYVIRPDG